MTEGIDENFAATVLSDDVMNKVTFGNGTTAIRQALASWPVDRLYYDTDDKILFRNGGTLNNPIWKPASKLIGSIELFAGPAADIPDGALICNGASISKGTYADLFAIIGTDFGAGDNNNEFKIPDFRDRIPRGSSDDTDHGSQGGNHDITADQLPDHTHDITTTNTEGSGNDIVPARISWPANTESQLNRDRPIGSITDLPDEQVPFTPPYTAVNYIIYT